MLTEKDYGKTSEQLKDMRNYLGIYGSVFNITNPGDIKNIRKINLYNRIAIPNQNRSITYVHNAPSGKRSILDLFNETIFVDDKMISSKMYLRSRIQYRSCSFWRCTWKNDNSTFRIMSSRVSYCSDRTWLMNQSFYNTNTTSFQGSYTVLLATYLGDGVSASQNFTISANIETIVYLGNSNYIWNQQISWFF